MDDMIPDPDLSADILYMLLQEAELDHYVDEIVSAERI
jgi:hypothetical protein